MTTISEEIQRLNELRESGALSTEEFDRAKSRVISAGAPAPPRPPQAGIDEDSWGMLIHLSQFCGLVIPFAGYVVPVVLWLVKRDDSARLDQHGRVVLNWLLTEVIAVIGFFLLSLVLIGIPLLVIVLILGIVFPIIGTVKASSGVVWRYPFSITFFSVDFQALSPANEQPDASDR